MHGFTVIVAGMTATVLSMAALGDAPAPPVYGTVELDVVALGEGSDAVGAEPNAVEHEGYRYLFATPEHAEAFSADPERYKIGLDGYCANMGPLAGRGRVSIVAVHDGRAYLCASEICKQTFLKNPEGHIDRDDPVPTVTPAQRVAGIAIIDRAIAAHFGDAGLDGARVYEERFEEDQGEGENLYKFVDVFAVRADGSARHLQAWNDRAWFMASTPAEAWTTSPDRGWAPMYECQRREFERRERDTHWVSILRNASQPGAVVGLLEASMVPGTEDPIERVVVAWDGATCVVGIDPGTGRVRTIEHTNRGAGSTFIPKTKVFSEYAVIDGATVPTAWDVFVDGTRYPGRSGVAVRLNPPDGDAGFERADP